MPELPEVETVCWRLREGGHGEPPLLGRRLDTVEILDAKVLRSGDIDAVHGARVVGIRRRAKWIVIDVERAADDDNDNDTITRLSLLLHLRMTGDLHVRHELPARFVRFVCTLDSGAVLVFTDPRRFGTLDVVDDITPHIDELGPEPLDDDFTAAVLAKQLKGKRAIKATLLSQDVVAGLGNIYADEALYLAGIHPETSTSALTAAQVERLHAGIQKALRESVAAARTELAWRYENKSAPSPFRVYDRGGEPCLACGTVLSSTTVGGRTTVWCTRCQPRS